MQYETVALLTVTVICATVSLVTILADSRVMLNHGVGRVWSAAFVSAIFTSVSYVVAGSSPQFWPATALGNAAMVFSIGSVWSGARMVCAHRPRHLVVGALSVLVAIASIPSSDAVDLVWTGTPAKIVVMLVFSALILVEVTRGRARGTLFARILGITMALHIAFLALRLVLFVVLGPDDAVFVSLAGASVTAAVNLALLGATAAAVLSIRWGRVRRRASMIVRGTSALMDAVSAGVASTGADSVYVMAITIDLFDHVRASFGRGSASELRATLETVAASAIEGSALPASRGALVASLRDSEVMVVAWGSFPDGDDRAVQARRAARAIDAIEGRYARAVRELLPAVAPSLRFGVSPRARAPHPDLALAIEQARADAARSLPGLTRDRLRGRSANIVRS